MLEFLLSQGLSLKSSLDAHAPPLAHFLHKNIPLLGVSDASMTIVLHHALRFCYFSHRLLERPCSKQPEKFSKQFVTDFATDGVHNNLLDFNI